MTKVLIMIKERKYKGRLKYMFFRKHSDKLAIIFSGIPADGKAMYNYVRTLRNTSMDQLFLLDDFGFGCSYHWYEDGSLKPKELTQSLIAQVINRGGYREIYTIGSSKGGTDAIYYGLLFNANAVYSGACQYYVGDYLNFPWHEVQLSKMVGKRDKQEVIYELNRMLPDIISKSRSSSTIIHLLYSKEEHTYSEHIVYLIKALDENGILHFDTVENFRTHSDIALFFPAFLKHELNFK